MSSPTPLPQSFISKKQKILEALAVPEAEYDDLSPKGSVDEGIRDLIDEINQMQGCVTTSSCAGRVSVFLEGKKDTDIDFEDVERKKESGEVRTKAGVGGKGGGGKWLYVSHEPFDRRNGCENKSTELFGMYGWNKDKSRTVQPDEPGWERWVHFKFEPMILHVLTASLHQAQVVLSAALQAGFRESGAINLISSNNDPATPMVAVRSMGLSLESIVGCGDDADHPPSCIVPEETLECLVEIANERFKENTKRIERFRTLLKKLSLEDSGDVKRKGQEGEEWEDPQVRRERKRAEGLMRSQQVKEIKQSESLENPELVDTEPLDQIN